MKRNIVNTAAVLLGIGIAVVGFVLQRAAAPDGGFMQVLSYVLIGLGCGAFGHSAGDLLGSKALQSDPELARRIEIETTDERNIALANAAKARAFDRMLYIFGALMVVLVLMQAELAVVLLFVTAYLFIVGSSVYYRCKYEKEM